MYNIVCFVVVATTTIYQKMEYLMDHQLNHFDFTYEVTDVETKYFIFLVGTQN